MTHQTAVESQPGAPRPESRRRWLKQALVAAAGMVMPPTVRAAQPAVKVGLSLPLTARAASSAASATNIVPDLGLDYLAGFNTAIEIERRGMEIETVALDDADGPQAARANVEDLERQGVVAVSGGWSGTKVRAMLPVLEAAQLPMVGICSGAPDLRSGTHPMLFHLRPGYDDELNTLVKVMGGAGFTRLGVLHAGDDFGRMGLTLLGRTPAEVVKAQSVARLVPADAAAAAREIVSTPGVQSLLVLTPVEVLASVMTELRIRKSPFLAPVSALSHVLCNKLAAARDPVYRAFAVTCPYPNPLYARSGVAARFRDAMADAGLDHADRSYSAFEGFVAGSLLARALVSVRAAPTRQALAAALRAKAHDLGGLRIAFDAQQVGWRRVSFLYKSPADGNFRA